nr:MAG TPA: hypothetical protein [Caudoviricetes sp.]
MSPSNLWTKSLCYKALYQHCVIDRLKCIVLKKCPK